MSTMCATSGVEVFAPGSEAGKVSHDEKPAAKNGAASMADSWIVLALRRVVVNGWNRLLKVWAAQRPAKKNLRVCESVSLGDKRFVAVVQVGNERFLIGGATNSIAMLTRLAEGEPSFSEAMKSAAAAPQLSGSDPARPEIQ